MGGRRRHRILAGILKDVTSMVKATLSAKHNTARIYTSVVRATTHGVCEPPSDNRIATVISHGRGSRHAASTCIVALMDRLHGTKDACVALKCLFVIHSIVAKGSFILRDQLSIYPSFGGRNFLNLSKFHHDSDPESWELSCWVRWYAAVIEQNLTVSRFLGYYPSASLPNNYSNENKKDKIATFLNKDLLGEMGVLVNFVERICEAPDSLHLQRNNLIYEVVRLVGEDYRQVQREMSPRVVELRDKIPNLTLGELAQLLDSLKTLEDCRERLYLLFVNRNRNDELWELIRETKFKIMEMVVKDENKRLVKMETADDSSLTRSRERFAESGQLIRFNYGHEWFSFDPVPLTVSTVTVS